MLKRLLIVSSADTDLHRLEDQLRDIADFQVGTLRITDPADGAIRRALAHADLVIVCCRNQQLALLDAVSNGSGLEKPRILVCGELTSPEATRLLVRAGVADLLPSTPTTEELQAAIRRALRNGNAESTADRNATCVTVLGASGGVGTSFISSSLAHLAATTTGKSVLLVDLDLTYAPIAHMLGLQPVRALSDALEQLASLDAIALDGYTTRHRSGLQLLSAVPSGTPSRALDGAEFAALLRLARQRHDLVFVAANRWLDAASIESVAESRRVLILLGQTLTDLRNAMRLRGLMSDWLGISKSTLGAVINRHSHRAPMLADDIAETLDMGAPFLLPEDGEFVRHSIDSGTPPADLSRTAPLTEALLELESRLTGITPIAAPRGALHRIISTLSWSDR